MKGPLDRTKVVIRRLPPTITESTLMEQIDVKFAGRYNWVCFRPGKNRFFFYYVSIRILIVGQMYRFILLIVVCVLAVLTPIEIENLR